jgi:hypothetical protein
MRNRVWQTFTTALAMSALGTLSAGGTELALREPAQATPYLLTRPPIHWGRGGPWLGRGRRKLARR